MKTRRILFSAAVLALLLIVLVATFSSRYWLISKLNVQAGANENSLGLRQVAEIPLSGSATRFDYQSIDAWTGCSILPTLALIKLWFLISNKIKLHLNFIETLPVILFHVPGI